MAPVLPISMVTFASLNYETQFDHLSKFYWDFFYQSESLTAEEKTEAVYVLHDMVMRMPFNDDVHTISRPEHLLGLKFLKSRNRWTGDVCRIADNVPGQLRVKLRRFAEHCYDAFFIQKDADVDEAVAAVDEAVGVEKKKKKKKNNQKNKNKNKKKKKVAVAVVAAGAGEVAAVAAVSAEVVEADAAEAGAEVVETDAAEAVEVVDTSFDDDFLLLISSIKSQPDSPVSDDKLSVDEYEEGFHFKTQPNSPEPNSLNCEKAFSEAASERVLDEMVKLVDDPQTVVNNRNKALMLIESWGESSNELRYLPVFEETYKRDVPEQTYLAEDIEEEIIVARNRAELLSIVLSSSPQQCEDDLATMLVVQKCRESQTTIMRIIDKAGDNQALLFEALSVNDEIQKALSKYEDMEKPSSMVASAMEAAMIPVAVELTTCWNRRCPCKEIRRRSTGHISRR